MNLRIVEGTGGWYVVRGRQWFGPYKTLAEAKAKYTELYTNPNLAW